MGKVADIKREVRKNPDRWFKVEEHSNFVDVWAAAYYGGKWSPWHSGGSYRSVVKSVAEELLGARLDPVDTGWSRRYRMRRQ